MQSHLKQLALALLLSLSLSSVQAQQATPNKAAQGDYKVGDRLAQPKATPGSAGFELLDWDTLVPKDWNPEKLFKDLDFANLTDADPRAMEAMERLKKAWNEAPPNRALNGKRIRIPGFLVPLDAERGKVKEFLLVPYFGACIHTPPPPANQIIHAQAVKPLKEMQMMQAVWVSGTLEIARSDTEFGASTYRLKAERLEPYSEKK